MTSRSADPGVDRTVAAAALCRAVLLGRAVVTVTAAGAGLLIVPHPGRIVLVMAVVALSAAVQVVVLSRWPAVVRYAVAVLLADSLLLAGVYVLNAGSAAFYLFAAGAAALAGVLAGYRAWPLWAGQAVAGFFAAAHVLRAGGVTPSVAAFVVAFPMATVVTGLVAAAVTAATVRHVDLLVEVIAAAQRSAAASERARLARELHDSVAKTLRGVSFAAVALPASLRSRPELASRLADVIAEGADVAAREARDLIFGLRADDPGLPFAAAVSRICDEWSQASGTPVRVRADPVEPSPEARYELGRILHEALQNVARHASANGVDVGLRSSRDGGVRLIVQDDGHGFTVPADLAVLRADGHFGLLGMAERARSAGASFTVRSAPGSGTLVEVLVPSLRPALGPGFHSEPAPRTGRS
jgi:signal transduction histidine kinase